MIKLHRIELGYELKIESLLSLHMEFFKVGQYFDYSFPLQTPVASLEDLVNIPYENCYLNIFAPVEAEIKHEDGILRISGKTKGWGHPALISIVSKDLVHSIEPLSANVNLYPDNFVCGFKIEFSGSTFIILEHEFENQVYYGSQRVPQSTLTAMQLIDGMIENYWCLSDTKTSK